MTQILHTAEAPCLPTHDEPLSAYVRLLDAVPHPPDAPHAASIVQMSVIALRTYASTLRGCAHWLTDYADALERVYATSAQASGEIGAHPLAMRGRRDRWSVWSYLVDACQVAPRDTFLVAWGATLAIALGTKTRVRFSVGRRLRKTYPIASGAMSCDADRHRVLMREAGRIATALCEHADEPVPADTRVKTGRLITKMQVHVGAQYSVDTRLARSASTSTKEQTLPEVRASLHALRARIEAGDPDALRAGLAYCVGVPLTLLDDVLLMGALDVDWIVAIDPRAGISYVDLSYLHADMAQSEATGPRCIAASAILARPLPEFLHRALVEQLRAVPGAETIDDLPRGAGITGRTQLIFEGAPGRIKASVARLYRARGRVALESGLDRLRAALVTADFSLIGKSIVHYVTVGRTRLWEAAQQYSDYVSWGPVVPLSNGPAVGSAVTPLESTIRALDAWTRTEVARLRPGKRYTLSSLEGHHNTYTLAVAQRIHFLLGGREQAPLKYISADFTSAQAMLAIPDKCAGVYRGLLPVALLTFVAEQVALYRAHCVALDRRLAHIGIPSDDARRQYLAMVARLDDAPLFCTLSSAAITPIGTADLRDFVGPDRALAPDAGRKYWATLLANSGCSTSDVEAYLRHSSAGFHRLGVTSLYALGDAARRVAMVIGSSDPRHGMAPARRHREEMSDARQDTQILASPERP